MEFTRQQEIRRKQVQSDANHSGKERAELDAAVGHGGPPYRLRRAAHSARRPAVRLKGPRADARSRN
jgi:hypothetical protein